jgi:hypothetical protein
LLASREQAADLAAQILKGSFQNSAPRIEDNAPVLGKEVEFAPDSLPHTPFQAIARHGFTESARDRETESGERRIGSL